MTMTRRWLLRNAGRLAALGSAGGLGPLLGAGSPQGPTANANPLIVRSSRPQDFETPVGRLTSFITSNDLFFVRSHIHTPQVQARDWTLTVDGIVERPLTLRLADLEALPRVTSVITLECAGNGRAFFDPPVAGVQW
jgi:DMSO/TMAO reductase YedYZ molybdopterin-dependent catalytic subunit